MDVVTRALASAGSSSEPILSAVGSLVIQHGIRGGAVVDLGAGRGQLWPYLSSRFETYIGVDVVRYPDYPGELEFVRTNLNEPIEVIPDASADLVAAVETIEHLENPRLLMREMARVAKPGGWVLVTTPNQASFLSKMTLVFKNKFNAFQDSQYPAHIVALLPVDLLRIAGESGLSVVELSYTGSGRIPGTGRHFPPALSRLAPRSLSDNVLLLARKSSPRL